MPIGKGTVLVGCSERTTPVMVEQLAASLFAKEAAERVIACQMTKDRAHMHLDTVVARVLDHLGVDHDLMARWAGRHAGGAA